jgi:hypothetical protein
MSCVCWGGGDLGLESRLLVGGGSRGLIGCFPVPDSLLVCGGSLGTLTFDSIMEFKILVVGGGGC